MEFKFLKSAARVILSESPALSIPTIIADDRNSDSQEEGNVDNDDDLPSQDTGESISWSFLTSQMGGPLSDSIARGSCSTLKLGKKSLVLQMALVNGLLTFFVVIPLTTVFHKRDNICQNKKCQQNGC